MKSHNPIKIQSIKSELKQENKTTKIIKKINSSITFTKTQLNNNAILLIQIMNKNIINKTNNINHKLQLSILTNLQKI
jgi:hypothetical protein